MNRKYKKNIVLLYAFTFFDGFILAYVIERLFWAERGMSITMVVATEIIYGISVAVFELPSGLLADKFGRKKLLVTAGFLSVIEMILIYNAQDYWWFAAAVFLGGISTAMESGSLQAIMYDSLAAEGAKDNYEAVYGRFRAIDTAGSVIAAFLGAFTAYNAGMELNYQISIGSKFAAFILLLFLTEVPTGVSKERKEGRTLRDYYKEVRAFFKKNRLLSLYCMNGLVLGACWNYVDEFWQLLMQEVDVPVLYFGAIMVLYSIFTIPGNLMVQRIKGKINYTLFFGLIPFLYGGGFLLIGYLRNYLVLLPFIFLGIWHGFVEPLLSGCIQHHTKSSVRATMESVFSLMLRIVAIFVGLLFSMYADRSIFKGYQVLGAIALGFGVLNSILMVMQKQKKSA